MESLDTYLFFETFNVTGYRQTLQIEIFEMTNIIF